MEFRAGKLAAGEYLGKLIGLEEIKLQGGVFGGMAVKSKLWWRGGGGDCPAPSQANIWYQALGPRGGCRQVRLWFLFSASRTKIFQMNIFYSCRPISEKLKVT